MSNEDIKNDATDADVSHTKAVRGEDPSGNAVEPDLEPRLDPEPEPEPEPEPVKAAAKAGPSSPSCYEVAHLQSSVGRHKMYVPQRYRHSPLLSGGKNPHGLVVSRIKSEAKKGAAIIIGAEVGALAISIIDECPQVESVIAVERDEDRAWMLSRNAAESEGVEAVWGEASEKGALTVDGLCAGIKGGVAILVVNTPGSVAKILAGAKKALKKHKPIVIVSCGEVENLTEVASAIKMDAEPSGPDGLSWLASQ